MAENVLIIKAPSELTEVSRNLSTDEFGLATLVVDYVSNSEADAPVIGQREKPTSLVCTNVVVRKDIFHFFTATFQGLLHAVPEKVERSDWYEMLTPYVKAVASYTGADGVVVPASAAKAPTYSYVQNVTYRGVSTSRINPGLGSSTPSTVTTETVSQVQKGNAWVYTREVKTVTILGLIGMSVG